MKMVVVGLGLVLVLDISFPAPGCICVCAGSTRRCLRGPLIVSAFSKLGKNMHTLTQVYSKTRTCESLRTSDSVKALWDSKNQVFAIEYHLWMQIYDITKMPVKPHFIIYDYLSALHFKILYNGISIWNSHFV